jgi:hypothetical protein
LDGLRRRLDRGDVMTYAANKKFAVGVGKSALITREWRRLRGETAKTTVYVRCGPEIQGASVGGACNGIVESMSRNNGLWAVATGLLLRYANESETPVIQPGAIGRLVAKHKSQPQKVWLGELLVYELRPTLQSLTQWILATYADAWRDVVLMFFDSMLSEPPEFPAKYTKLVKKRSVDGFVTLLHLAALSNVGHLYIFLDQFEELFHGRGKKQVIELSSSMRTILEASVGVATFVVTLHPNAHMELNGIEGQSLTGIAPLDATHVVNLPIIRPDQALAVAETYLDHFRVENFDGPRSSPFEEAAIKALATRCEGNLREFLQMLHRATDVAVESGANNIDLEFLSQHHLEITGKLSERDRKL